MRMPVIRFSALAKMPVVREDLVMWQKAYLLAILNSVCLSRFYYEKAP